MPDFKTDTDQVSDASSRLGGVAGALTISKDTSAAVHWVGHVGSDIGHVGSDIGSSLEHARDSL